MGLDQGALRRSRFSNHVGHRTISVLVPSDEFKQRSDHDRGAPEISEGKGNGSYSPRLYTYLSVKALRAT